MKSTVENIIQGIHRGGHKQKKIIIIIREWNRLLSDRKHCTVLIPTSAFPAFFAGFFYYLYIKTVAVWLFGTRNTLLVGNSTQRDVRSWLPSWFLAETKIDRES